MCVKPQCEVDDAKLAQCARKSGAKSGSGCDAAAESS
jgi:hypothetical protein